MLPIKLRDNTGLADQLAPLAQRTLATLGKGLRRVLGCGLLAGLVLTSGCRQDMHDQPRYEPLEASAFFADGRSARSPIPGTVARGQLRADTHLYTGKISGELAATMPFPVTHDLLQRGQERYNIYCSPCHDRVGTGQGMIVRRGFQRPPSFHTPRLREAPIGHYVDVISQGFGAMMGYAAQVKPHDRWAIAAYIRSLQLSQHAALTDVPTTTRPHLQDQTP